MPSGYTPTQEKILEVLADGTPHGRQELINCLDDAFADRRNLNVHLSNLRARMRPIGEDIVCRIVSRRICYQHVILLLRDNGE